MSHRLSMSPIDRQLLVLVLVLALALDHVEWLVEMFVDRMMIVVVVVVVEQQVVVVL
jgi:hypothetical protein